jgi:hypothetical protein
MTSARRLIASGGLLAVLMAASPFIVRWAYQDWNLEMVLLADGPAVPFVGFVALTTWQQRRGASLTSFAARPLSTAVYLMSIWVLGACVLGFVVLLIGVIVLPLSTACLALAWVQPYDEKKPLTVVLAVVALPFVTWFVGRADEYMSEALVSGGVVALIVALLGMLRRSGTRRTAPATT